MTTQTDEQSSSSSSTTSFFTKLEARVKAVNSHLCVGLDPHINELFPDGIGDKDGVSEQERCDAAYEFCKRIIDATAPHAAAYKPNAAFFEALGSDHGTAALRRVVRSIPDDIPVLLDVKRGDIGSTASAYADACYDEERGIGADGVTLSPLMGWDSVRPFVTGRYSNRGAFLLCKTSNPGSDDLLALTLRSGRTVFEEIAHLADDWSRRAADSSDDDDARRRQPHPPPPCLGLVVGATDPTALRKARSAAGPDVWILAPGVGAQGGDLDEACRAGFNDRDTNLLVPVSRAISRSDDVAGEAEEFKERINAARRAVALERSFDRTAADGTKDVVRIEPYQRDFLEFALAEGVLKFGSFVLKSGRTSPYFFNAGLFASGESLHRLGKAYAAAIMASKEITSGNDSSVNFDVVFGPAYKGISLGALVCASLYDDFGVNVGFAYNRKEAKDHGEGGVLVGASMENKRVLVVDDVITAGTAIRESHALLTSVGAATAGVVIALDRAEKRSLDDPISAVQAVARDLSVPVISIVSLPQLQAYLEEGGSLPTKEEEEYGPEVLKSVSEYRERYGV